MFPPQAINSRKWPKRNLPMTSKKHLQGFDEEIEFPAQEAVKVKIEFTSGGKIRNGIDCYSPHDKSEVPSTMALDEIEIY